jgi:hypothetical protein
MPLGPEMRDLDYVPGPITTAISHRILRRALVLHHREQCPSSPDSASPHPPTRVLLGPKSVYWLTGSHASDVWEPDALDTRLEWIQ